MKNTSHQKIRGLLQTAADQALLREEQMVLDSHLAECSDCRTYAQGLDQLQGDLRRVMQQQWTMRSRPLAVETIKNRSGRIAARNHVVGAVRKFAFVPMLAFVFFMLMSVKVINPQRSASSMGLVLSNTPSIALLVPKPAAGLTATKLLSQACEKTTYIVQEYDTLNGIAIKYGISKESIMAYNALSSDKIEPRQVLVIPFCERISMESTTTPTVPNTSAPSNNAIDPSPRG